MKLPSELFCWLKALRLIKHSPDFQAMADYQDLDPHDQKEIEYGLTVLKLADKICAIKKIEYLKLGAEHAVPIFTKAKMIINWRTGFNLLAKLGLGLEPELLNLIINGDSSIVVDVMTLIYKRFGKKVDLSEHDEAATLKALGLSESRVGHPPSAQHSISEMQSAIRQDDSLNRGDGNTLVPLKIPRAQSSIAFRQGMSAKSRSVLESVKNDSQYLKANLPTLNQTTLSRNYSMAGSKLNLADFKLSVSSQLIPLDINQIELHQPRAEDIDHLFQYLLVTSASAFRMKVSTVLPLFSGGGKILANMIVKGVRYEELFVDWFTRLKADVPRIFEMILTDRSWSTLKLFLTTVKPGLISKSTEVSQCVLSILTKLCLMQKERNLLNPTYDWAVAPTGIIGMLIFCTKRHIDKPGYCLRIIYGICNQLKSICSIDLEPEVFNLIKVLTIDAHLPEFVYKVEEFIDNSKQFNFFIHSSLHYFLRDSSMRHQIEGAGLEVMWMERVLQEMAQYYRSFDLDLFYGLCILVDYWAFVGFEFNGTSNFSDIEIIGLIGHYITKQKGNNKFKETFKHYVKSDQTKILILTQLFRILDKALERPLQKDPEELDTLRQRDEEQQYQKRVASKSKALIKAIMEILVTFISENLDNPTIRQYVLENLTPYIKKKKVQFESYFRGYLKQMLAFIGHNHTLNLFDMAFILAVITAGSFTEEECYGILESLLGLFFLSISQARFLLTCMNKILKKLDKNHPSLVKWCLDTVRLALNRYMTLEKKRKRPPGPSTKAGEPANTHHNCAGFAWLSEDRGHGQQRPAVQPQREGDLCGVPTRATPRTDHRTGEGNVLGGESRSAARDQGTGGLRQPGLQELPQGEGPSSLCPHCHLLSVPSTLSQSASLAYNNRR